MNICINCYYKSNINELIKCISSLFLNPNHEEINKNLEIKSEFYDQIDKKIEDQLKTYKKYSICYGAFMSRLKNCDTKFTSINECLTTCIKQFNFRLIRKPKTKFNIVLQVDCLGDNIVPNFEYFYNTMDFNHFLEIVMWNFNITKKEYMDQFGGKSLDYNRPNKYFNYSTARQNENFKTIAKKYFETEFKNKSEFGNKIKIIYEELKDLSKKIGFNVILRGSKYHTSLTINRNYCMSHTNGNWTKFLDDDDLSCSLNSLENCLRLISKFNVKKNQIACFNPFNITNFDAAYISTFTQLIIGPNIKYPYTKIKYVEGEDWVFCHKNKDDIIGINTHVPIYYRFKANKTCSTPFDNGLYDINKRYFKEDKSETPNYFGFEFDDKIEFITI